jgi:chromate reductase, NAD(P)H dehydrogenase (quinone)
MARIIGISGSLRHGSFNTALLRAAAEVAPADITLEVAVMGASPSRFGTTLSQSAWLPVIRTLGMRPCLDERLSLFEARKMFDADGKLTDEHTRERMVRFVQGYCAFIRKNAAS